MSKPTHNQTERPPIIAIMGHIDHGKSTLLDYIRKTNVVAGEAGGITQHVSAYEVVHKNKDGVEKKITFIDTPGHAAFETSRSRGANIADIAVLVVSAEEGVKAQTLEALRSIEESKTPYIIAINKTDRPNANVDRTKQSLAENNILVESYGGKIPSVSVSAKTGEGIDELLDLMLIVAELEELKATPTHLAEGYVLEANLDPKIGTTVTMVVKDGTLHTGDYVVIENTFARAKKLEDFLGNTVKESSFSSPVRIFGFTGVPTVGALFTSFDTKKAAEQAVSEFKLTPTSDIQNTNKTGETEALTVEIPLIIKTDVVGTLEAVRGELQKLETSEVKLKITQAAVGAITEGDVKMLIGTTGPIILGFNVKVDSNARDLADRNTIPIQTFDIIYKLAEWVAEEVVKRKPLSLQAETVGKAKIQKLFSKVKDRQVVGGTVLEGKIMRGREVKVLRHEHEVGRGKIVELQQQKLRADKIEAPEQFGAMIESKIELAPGDFVEVFDMVEK